MFTKTHRECIPAGSGAASLLLTVLANISVSCHRASPYGAGCSGNWNSYIEERITRLHSKSDTVLWAKAWHNCHHGHSPERCGG